jgi:hypothetical protein
VRTGGVEIISADEPVVFFVEPETEFFFQPHHAAMLFFARGQLML